jgi:PAS domain S-box-containing protein
MDKVLYVDDEKDLLDIGKLFLEENGQFSVCIIDSVPDALSLLQETDFDAIVSDFQMPDRDGIAFLKAVREQNPGIPFILFTGRGREEVVIEAINNGADFYVQKGGEPTSQFAELAHKIRQAVARRRAQDELRAAYQQLSASDAELREQYRQLAMSEQRIRDREKKFRAIFEKTHDALLLFTKDGCIDCNHQAVTLFGYESREEFIGKKPLDISPPAQPDGLDSQTATDAHIRTVYERGTDRFEWLLKRKDGSRFLGDILLSAFDLDGKPVFLCSVRDITRLKQVQEELSQSEELYRALVAHIQDGVFLSQDTIVRYSNQILAVMLGYPAPEPGMPITKFIAPGYRAIAIERQQSRLAGKALEEFFPFQLLHRDGITQVTVMLSVGIGTYKGRPAIIGTVRDMSEKHGRTTTIPEHTRDKNGMRS